jgi:outer membrane receptor protein involved in Fe transport
MPGIQPNGAAYQDQIALYNSYYVDNPATPLPNEWYSYKSRFDYLQVAEFADLTLHLADRWSIEAGVQHFQSSFSTDTQYAGYFWNYKQPSGGSGGSHKVNAKAGLTYKPGNNLLLYGTFSQGFRDGGINVGLGESCLANGAPGTFKPDTLNNFEVGWKSTLFGGRIVWNGAAYVMNWQGYQVPVFDDAICPSGFNANLGKARIYGTETSVSYRVAAGLTLQASGTYNDPHLLSNAFENPDYVVLPGERLPFVPYLSYSANVRYEHPVTAALSGYVQYDIAHKGDSWSSLRITASNGGGRELQPAYDISNLRVGVQSPAGRWTTEFYVTNLFDKNAVVYINTSNYDNRETTNQPRVVGLRLNYRWGDRE